MHKLRTIAMQRTYPIVCYFWVEPTGKGIRCLYEEKLSIGVNNLDPQVIKRLAQLLQEKYYEPFILYRIAIVRETMKVL
jgi:hypothetical protein